MVTDFTRSYSPPGVYINEDDTTTLAISSGIPSTLVALIGPAVGHQTITEQISLGVSPVLLSRKGVDQSSVSIVVVSTRVVVDPTTYTLSQVNAGTAAGDYQIRIVANSNSTLDDGTAVFVTYQYTPPDYFTAKYVTTFDDVKALYGEPLNLSPGSSSDPDYVYVTSPLSLAAKVAFENGATDLVLCAVPQGTGSTAGSRSSSLRANFHQAYVNLATLPTVNVVVPVVVGIASADAAGVLTDLANYVTNAGSDGFYQFAVVGFDAAVGTSPDSLVATAGSADDHVMFAYAAPGGMLMYSSGVNGNFSASHAYLAAAYAGKMASLDVQRSLTKQTINSFSGISGTPLTNAVKNQYSAAGIAVAEISRLGSLTVRHGVTTDITNINTREASVVRAKDALVTLIRNGFDSSGLVSQPIDDELVITVKSTIQQYLDTAEQAGTIISYKDLICTQDSSDPSLVNITFAYKPAYPLNYISIGFSIDTTTGVIDTTATAA